MAIAYFLDPVADRLERLGLSRMMATIGILVAFVIVFTLALMILIPVLISQFNDFAQRLPGYISQLQQFITQAQNSLLPDWVENQMGTIKDNLSGILSEGMGFLTGLFAQIWNSGKAIVDVISLLVVTPVVAFYILLDWDRMVAKVDQWIPRDYVGDVRQIAKEIDQAIAGFIRGQGSLCLILGIYYAVGLSLVGLNFGLLIGLFAKHDQFHSLCRLDGWPRARHRRGACAILARLSLDRPGARRLLQWPVPGRQHSAAEARRLQRRPASGLADVCAFCLRRAVRFCRASGRRA